MSASNWAICPKCENQHKTDYDKAQEELDTSYGKISSRKYLKYVEDFNRLSSYLPDDFREDYEIGIQCSEFYVIYKGHCTKCDFSFEYRYDFDLTKELGQ